MTSNIVGSVNLVTKTTLLSNRAFIGIVKILITRIVCEAYKWYTGNLYNTCHQTREKFRENSLELKKMKIKNL